MRSLILWMLCILWVGGRGQVAAGYVLVPVGAQPVPVSVHRVTSLVFPMAIRTGVRVSPDVKAEKVKGLENVIALRAARGSFVPTNLAVFGMDGRVYSFNLEYSDSAAAWQYRVEPTNEAGHGLMLAGLPADLGRLNEDARMIGAKPGWMHVLVNTQKMRLTVTGIWSADSLIWVAGRIRNRSRLVFDMGQMRLFMEDRKRIKRMAIQEGELDPVWTSGTGSVSGETTNHFVLGYRSINAPKGKRLVLEITEKDGGRLIRVKVPYKKILAAKKLP